MTSFFSFLGDAAFNLDSSSTSLQLPGLTCPDTLDSFAGMSCQLPSSQQQLASDNSSDYGSDFTPEQEALVDELLANATGTENASAPTTAVEAGAATTPANAIGDTALQTPEPTVATVDIEDYYDAHSQSSPRVPRVLGREKPGASWQLYKTTHASSPREPQSSLGTSSQRPDDVALVEHPNSLEGRERNRERDLEREREWTAPPDATRAPTTAAALAKDTSLSPIERFRRPPNKAFSVSDLISPAWCELQYWYTLTKYGRKRRTPAMKKGSTIHKTLEDEVHTTVPVEITTKEDAMALRIWNIIQGLRSLREFGMTRELEIWGLVDGELVNGVIDQLSYECPDPELEATAAAHYADVEASRVALPEYQMSLTDYLLSSSQGGQKLSDVWSEHQDQGLDLSPPPPPPEAYNILRVYLTDNKTRASGSAPTVKSTSFRPTLLQLQLYYHMLNRLVTTDDVNIELLASRYNLDPERPFTDAFVAEVGGLNDQFFDAMSSQEFDPDFIPGPEDAARRTSSPPSTSNTVPPPSSQDSTGVLLANNNLSSLWRLMKDQLRLTFLPPPSESVSMAPSIPSEVQPSILESYPTVLSPLLTARYISAAPEANSRLLGSRSFLYDPVNLNSYLSDQMNWWYGQRDPRGVEVMEAWKCRICEFRDECSWRQEKAWSLANQNRGRKRANA